MAKEEAKIISYAEELSKLTETLPVLLAINRLAAGKKDPIARDLYVFANRHYFGSGIYEDGFAGSMKELTSILQAGIEYGAGVSNKLKAFSDRLKSFESLSNSIRSKTAGSRITTLLGLVFFFPAFSGISIAIIKMQFANPLNFMIAALAYCITSIFISVSFEHLQNNWLKNALISLPYALTSVFVLLASFYFANSVI